MSIRKYLNDNWNVICDVCGKKRKRSECELAYGTGNLAVVVSCIDGCADFRNPLNDPPPVIFDGRPVPDARPEQPSQFVSTAATDTLWRWGFFPENAGSVWGNLNGTGSSFSTNTPMFWGFFP